MRECSHVPSIFFKERRRPSDDHHGMSLNMLEVEFVPSIP